MNANPKLNRALLRTLMSPETANIVADRLEELERVQPVWQPMKTAPKGGGADRTDDPKWVEPPELLMAFEDDSLEICYWDWYYAPGGRGYAPGVSAWVGANGEQVARFQGDPIAWMPLPLPPNRGAGKKR